MKRFWKWLIGDWWVVRQCGFPFPSGYATYNKFRNMICDTGLSKELAKAICKEMNK